MTNPSYGPMLLTTISPSTFKFKFKFNPVAVFCIVFRPRAKTLAKPFADPSLNQRKMESSETRFEKIQTKSPEIWLSCSKP